MLTWQQFSCCKKLKKAFSPTCCLILFNISLSRCSIFQSLHLFMLLCRITCEKTEMRWKCARPKDFSLFISRVFSQCLWWEHLFEKGMGVEMSHICTVLIVKLLSNVESDCMCRGGWRWRRWKSDKTQMILFANFILHFQWATNIEAVKT